MSMQDVNIEFEVPTLPEIDVSLEIVTNGTFWGNVQGDITEQTDLIDLIDTKIDIEATARENNDLALQNGINTLNDDLTAEISNRGTADGILQDNIDTLSDTVTNNYNALDSAITSEATTRANADTTLQSNIDTLSSTVTSNYNTLNGAITSEQTERENADNTLQDNIDTLSETVTNNYNTLDGKIGDNKTAIDNHIADKSNPHDVSKAQVGLGNVDNTSDLNKPISTATQNALNGKANTSDLSTVATTGDYDDLSNKPTIPTVNDATLTIQKNGSNVATFTANSSTNQTANITVPTQASDIGALPDTTTINDLTTSEQQSALNSGATSTNIGQIATNTQNISNEVTNRQNADNNLQSQIDALVVASDVFDIVGTYAELQAYDISTVPVNDIIKVLVDSTHDNAATYYRCVENDNVKSWLYIGAEGAYYTKSEADNRFVEQTTTINGQALSNNITLDAEDVGALPDSTTIGNGTLTIQKNGSTIDSFGANDTGNTTVNITVPTDTGDLTNNAGYITGINSTDVINALGYTPYNSTNPDGYTDNVGTVISVNNTQPDANGNVTISIPTQVQANWNETDTSSKAYIQNKPNLSTVATTGDYNDLTNKPTIPTVGDGTITINQGGVQKGTFTTNQSGNTTIDLDAGGGGTSTDVQINGTSITSGGVADIVTEGEYDATDNKIATMSDVPTKTSELTNDSGYTTNKGTVTKVNNTSPDSNGNVTISIPDDTSDLTNGAGFITGINSTDVTTALGYTPYDSSNPAGYTDNVGTVTSVNNTQPDANGNVTLSIPDAQVQSNWNETDNTSKAYIKNKPTIPTETSDLTNDSGFIPNTATGDSGLTILGTANSQTGAINIGASSSVTTNFGVAIGYNASSSNTFGIAIGNGAEASGSSSLAIGYDADVSGTRSIQIGKGTNNTNFSLAVGFGTIGEYQLLDGTTGLIPDARISSNIARTSDLSTVATSGSYNDLSDKPTIPAAQVQANWNETDTSSKAYIQNKPTLSTVATTGDYDDLTNKPTIPAAQVQSNWNETDTTSKAYIQNKPSLSTVATSGNYNDLSNKPTIPTVNDATLTIQKNGTTVQTFTANASSNVTCNIAVPTNTNELTNGAGFITGISSSDVTTALGYTPYDSSNPDGYTTNVGTVTSVNNTQPDANGDVTISIPTQVQANWNETDTTSKAYIQNKPSLSTVATTGDYNDLSNKPTIPAAQVNSDWNASSGVAQILNKPTLSTVATTGDYDDLTNKPTIPAAQVQANWNETDNTSKAYIQNKPTIPSTSNFVTTNTAQNISARKTFVGEKAIYFKQSTTSNKLGFTLYNTSNTEVGGLEYNPSSNILALNAPKTGNTLLGFRYWSGNNIIVPKPSSSGDYYLPLSFKNGSSTVTTNSSGVADLSNLIPTIATSVSSSSTNDETVGAKLFYDTVGNIETLLSEV